MPLLGNFCQHCRKRECEPLSRYCTACLAYWEVWGCWPGQKTIEAMPAPPPAMFENRVEDLRHERDLRRARATMTPGDIRAVYDELTRPVNGMRRIA